MPAFDRSASINVPYRIWLSLVIAFICFFTIILRLWYLQIVNGDYFRSRSENNRTRIVYTPSPRGLVFDRNGEVLVRNRPSFNVDFVPEDAPDIDATLQRLAAIAEVPVEELHERLKDQKRRRRFEPKLLLKDVSRDLVGKIAARRHEMPGLVINAVPAREYVFGGLAAHLIGYIREITVDQLKNAQYSGYRSGDVVGQYGIEARWERYLRGERGTQAVVVNAMGTRIAELSFEPEIPGHNVTLTISRRLQETADKLLEGKRGAIVAMDPRNGEILALSSGPSFDPNMFTTEISKEAWQDLVLGKDHKLNNRAVQGAYPPGSVFKIFVALAALTEEVTNSSERMNCPGFLQFGKRAFKCHLHRGHGSMSLYDAIVRSCDVYFYVLGQRLGVDRIAEYAKRFGFGEPTDLGLIEENPGLIPSSAWKAAYFRNPEDKRWYPGETLPVAIGQGAVTTTPLQVARALSAVINGGLILKPQLVRSVVSPQGVMLEEHTRAEVVRAVELDPALVTLVRRAMVGVVNDQHGTGHKAQLPKGVSIPVGGKTGTSQVSSKDSSLEDHAWFAGYAPADEPEIVVVAIVENGGHGGAAAAPLVQKVLAKHFGLPDGDEPKKPVPPDNGDED